MPPVAAIAELFGGLRRVTSHTNDVALATRVSRGDKQALALLYAAHHEAVRAFARRMLGDAADAEDLVQDVFLAAREALAGFEGRSSVRTFLVSVAVNQIRHKKRATARRLGALERLHEEPRAQASGPEEAGERKELAGRMQKLLDALPLDQRLAVVLCVVEERTSVEAAEIVGVPEATIRTRVFHARKRMRELLASEAPARLETTSEGKMQVLR